MAMLSMPKHLKGIISNERFKKAVLLQVPAAYKWCWQPVEGQLACYHICMIIVVREEQLYSDTLGLCC